MRAGPSLAALLVLLTACPTPPYEYPPGPPKIVRFRATPYQVPSGTETQLEWAVERADRVTLEGRDVPLQGAERTTVTGTRTVLLDAVGPGGSSRARLELAPFSRDTVSIVAFSSSPARARPGDPVQLQWTTSGATQVSLRERNRGPLLDPAPPSGSFILRAERDAIFELRADGPGGPAMAEAVLVVATEAPLVEQLRIAPAVILPHELSTLSWSVTDADEVAILARDQAGAEETLAFPAPSAGAIAIGGDRGSLALVLRASGPGGTVEETVELLVVEAASPEIASFTLDPPVSGAGGHVLARFDVRFADEVRLFARGQLAAVAAAGAGQARFVAPAETSLITLLASTLDGRSATATATLAIDPLLPAFEEARIEPPSPRPGEVAVLVWRVQNAEWLTVTTELGELLLSTTSSAAEGRIEREVTAAETFVLRAGSARGTTTRTLALIPAE